MLIVTKLYVNRKYFVGLIHVILTVCSRQLYPDFAYFSIFHHQSI